MHASRLVLAALIGCGAAFAQLSPTTLPFKLVHPTSAGITLKSVAVTGSGTPSVSACGSNTGANNICTYITATPGPNSVNFWWSGGVQSYVIALGSTAQFTITLAGGTCSGGCPLTISLDVVAQTYNRIFTTPSGTISGCNTAGSPWLVAENCANADMGGVNRLAFPTALGGKYTDENYGGTAVRVTAQSTARALLTDSVESSASANGKKVVNINLNGGAVSISNADGSGDACSIGDSANFTWDPTDDNTYYTMPQVAQGTNVAQIIKHTACGGTSVVVTYPGFADQLITSDDGGPSREGDWAVMTNPGTSGNDPVLMIVDLKAGVIRATYNYQTNPIAVWGGTPTPGHGQNSLRGEITNAKSVSAVNGKLWFIVTVYQRAEMANEFFSWTPGSSTIVDEGPEPFTPEMPSLTSGLTLKVQPATSGDCNPGGGFPTGGVCPYGQHADFVEVPVNGVRHQMYFTDAYGMSGGPTQYWMTAMDLDNPGGVAKIKIAAEDGGGEYGIMPIAGGGHNGCSFYSICIEGSETALTAYQLTTPGVTTGANSVLTIAGGTTGLVAGQGILMNGELANSELAGVNTACSNLQTITGTTVTCQGTATTGSWTAGTGTFIANVLPAATPYQSNLFTVDFNNFPSVVIRQLLKTRTFVVNDRISANGYWPQNHPSMSADATTFAYHTNEGGIPERMSVWAGSTGYPNRVSAAAVGAAAVGAAR